MNVSAKMCLYKFHEPYNKSKYFLIDLSIGLVLLATVLLGFFLFSMGFIDIFLAGL